MVGANDLGVAFRLYSQVEYRMTQVMMYRHIVPVNFNRIKEYPARISGWSSKEYRY